MPNPDALWQDIQKLDDMYEELMWHPDDELQFTHDGEKIIITNKTLEDQKMFNEKAEKLNGRSNGWIRCRSRIIPCNRSSHPRFMVNDMLVIAAHDRRVYLCCPVD